MNYADLFVSHQVEGQNQVWFYPRWHLGILPIFNGTSVRNNILRNLSESRSFSCHSNTDEDLYRLNKTTPPSADFYDPLLPVLWMTM